MSEPNVNQTQPPGRAAAKHATHSLPPNRSDNIDLLKALFLGIAATAVFYEVFPLPLIERGRILTLFEPWVSQVITAMTFGAFFLLLLKYLQFRRQLKAQRAFNDPRLMATIENGIYAKDVEDVLERLNGELGRQKIKNFQGSVIYRRIFRLLHYVRSLPKKEALNDILVSQSQIDVKKLETGYTVLQVLIWAIPIMGFIGTVLGIGEAVAGFSGFIQTAEGGTNFSMHMRTALGEVTSGLAVAFNTTFLGLVLVIPVMIATSILQKNEEELLLDVEEFSLEKLLPHIHITPSSDTVTEPFDEHMHRILQLSNAWLGRFEPLVDQLSQRLEMINHQMVGIQPVVKEFTDRLLESDPLATTPGAAQEPEQERPGPAGSSRERGG